MDESNLTDTNFSTVTGISSDAYIVDSAKALDQGIDENTLPVYLRVTLLIFFVIIFAVGTVGNIMVTMVIYYSRDMRTSTNIFLVNLSVADLLVLVVCTPTALIEVTYDPNKWILGFHMCKLVPLLEQTVANASVFTILAISFERYYVICRPLNANSFCRKSRAVWICIMAWVLATVVTSPMYFMIFYHESVQNGTMIAQCMVESGRLLPDLYTVSSIVLFFVVPFFILLVTYAKIAKGLTMDSTLEISLNAKDENLNKARKQVVMMLGTVVFTFFLCLFPFRVLTLVVVFMDETFFQGSEELYFNIMYFCRILLYINSALNPILYNIMSSKFRNGFLRLCPSCCSRQKASPFTRNGTFLTNTTTSTNLSINFGHIHAIKGNNKSYSNSPSPGNSPELAQQQLNTVGLVRKNGVRRLDYRVQNGHWGKQANGHHLLLANGKKYETTPAPAVGPAKNGTFGATCGGAVHTKSLYSAYIPGRGIETVL